MRQTLSIVHAMIVTYRMSLAVNISNPDQLKASDPKRQIWVAASAGSGKTKVLTDRVLRLLLDGTPPSKILCITYTNAAATEMQTRIHETLSTWVMMPDVILTLHLEAITGQPPPARLRSFARTLFATLLEDNPALRIQTIHGFCQSLLARFPLEAGVPPAFDILDERTAKEMLKSAQNWLLHVGMYDHEDEAFLTIKTALQGLSTALGESKFQEIINAIISNRRHFEQLFHFLNEHFTDNVQLQDYLHSRLYHHVGLDHELRSREDIKHTLLNYTDADRSKIHALADTIEEYGKTEKKYIPILRQFAHDIAVTQDSLDEYCKCLLTQTGTPNTRLLTKDVKTQQPWLEDFIAYEQNRIIRYKEAEKAFDAARDAQHLITLAYALFDRYSSMKKARGLLDYDDLIFSARGLLCGERMMPWVLFKLDGGLNHILVDEAQDTSPLQWELIGAILEEFFSGENAFHPSEIRTVFIVGDEKQSIYKFQGADVATFALMHANLKRHIRERGQELEEVRLRMSYRSTPAILAAVDAIFMGEKARIGLSSDNASPQHTAFKEAKAGIVELWPLISTTQEKQTRFFPIITNYQDYRTSKLLLAERLADTIAHWLTSGRHLHAKQRPVKAGDILILVQRRNDFIGSLSRELKKRNVPIAGLDRMVLTDHIAIQDMLALAQFLLLPEDDLTLAGLLKSPLYGIDDETLFTLCHGRGKNHVWSRVKTYNGEHAGVHRAKKELAELLSKADYITPYALFAELLYGRGGRERMMARMGDEVIDPLSVFLSETMRYEQLHAPSLQGFLHWICCSDSEIKRDMEQGINAVRIMTVHGSKGLQAPIVILPDTTREPQNRDSILVAPSITEQEHPLFFLASSQDANCQRITTMKDKQKADLEAEYHRLLYVALTRAEEELYICGYEGKKTSNKNHWYQLIHEGFSRLHPVQTLNTKETYPYWKMEDGKILRYATFQPDIIHYTSPTHTIADDKEKKDLPTWATMTAPHEPTPPRPLAPSKIVEHIAAATLPHLRSDAKNVTRESGAYGTIIHRLLHLLSSCPLAERNAYAQNYLLRHASKISADMRETTRQEVMRVIQHPEFAPLFGEDSLAEVPLTGTIWDNIVVSGQVDRLVITQNQVQIIDFKTGKPPQQNVLPKAHTEQMRAYHALLSHIYPRHEIKCALLYTSILKLIPVTF